ncbi:glycosyltransferase [Capnocytophaga canis]|uniref:glycosyltransferase n=1 Tax=Capnocytophaga canis TaxID=1848903 RepID=UPI00156227F3|nr:glycosyltransferase [Capnocytophaga canis]
MKLLFVHDHPFFMENELVYSGGGLPYTAWKNYLVNFAEVMVYARSSENAKNKKIISSTENVSFHLTQKYSSALSLLKNKKAIERELLPLISHADVVLVRLPSILGIIAGNLAYIKKKPLWVEVVGNAEEAMTAQGSLLGKISAKPLGFLNKKLIQKADFVAYVTKSKLQKDYPAHPRAVSFSFSDVIVPKVLCIDELDKIRFSGNIFHIGLIGGFDAKYKGQDLLLKAVALLDEQIKRNIKIHLVGKGDYSWVLELAKQLNLISNLGYIGPLEAGEEINNFLKTLSLYIQPSLTEGMPRATIEAMAMGCPVIGSRVGGIPDIVSSEFLHEKGDYKTLSHHIMRLYLDRKVLEKEAEQSLDKAFPYLKTNLDKIRLDFYKKMNAKLSK